MRVEGKVAIVVGAGQTVGETIGNGRAAAILFAREGAEVFLVDRDETSLQETAEMIAGEGGVCDIHVADITSEAACEAMTQACVDKFGKLDIALNNVGIGRGDRGATSLTEDAWDNIMDVNLKAMWFCCKHELPHMRRNGSGSIVNISSVASIASTGMLAYKTSKAGVNALSQQIAMGNARHRIRCNAVLPGLMDTPMAIEGNVQSRGMERSAVRDMRNAMVPLHGESGESQMGTGWDTANAVLFLSSDEAKFITGVLLPVDGGQSVKVG